MTGLTIDVYAEVACPWCFIGLRRLEEALSTCPISRSRGADRAQAAFAGGALGETEGVFFDTRMRGQIVTVTAFPC